MEGRQKEKYICYAQTLKYAVASPARWAGLDWTAFCTHAVEKGRNGTFHHKVENMKICAAMGPLAFSPDLKPALFILSLKNLFRNDLLAPYRNRHKKQGWLLAFG